MNAELEALSHSLLIGKVQINSTVEFLCIYIGDYTFILLAIKDKFCGPAGTWQCILRAVGLRVFII